MVFEIVFVQLFTLGEIVRVYHYKMEINKIVLFELRWSITWYYLKLRISLIFKLFFVSS